MKAWQAELIAAREADIDWAVERGDTSLLRNDSYYDEQAEIKQLVRDFYRHGRKTAKQAKREQIRNSGV